MTGCINCYRENIKPGLLTLIRNRRLLSKRPVMIPCDGNKITNQRKIIIGTNIKSHTEDNYLRIKDGSLRRATATLSIHFVSTHNLQLRWVDSPDSLSGWRWGLCNADPGILVEDEYHILMTLQTHCQWKDEKCLIRLICRGHQIVRISHHIFLLTTEGEMSCLVATSARNNLP